MMGSMDSSSWQNRRRQAIGALASPPSSPSAMSLVKSLVRLGQRVAVCERPRVCQRRNSANMARRIKLLSPLFEEIRDTRPPLPPSAILAFQDLHTTMQRAKLLLDFAREGSCLWLLMDNDAVAELFHELTRDLASELDSLPLDLLDLSDEVREQVELLCVQVRRAKVYVEPSEAQTKDKLVQMTSVIDRKETPDFDELRELLDSLRIVNARDCEQELRLLDEELGNQVSNDGGLEAVSSLIRFARYCKCVFFGEKETEEEAESEPSRDSGARFDAGEVSTSGSDASGLQLGAAVNPPDEFRCPISLDLMRDPVIVATGQTYDRSSIAKWLEAGNSTCPKTRQKLLHVSMIPNYALRSLIVQWCEDHHFPFEKPDKCGKTGSALDHIAITHAALEATKITAAFLVGKLATGSPEVQKQVAYELRLLAKCGMDNRMCIAEAGAIPFLVPLLSSKDPKTQENAVTALLNLSIYANNKTLIMGAGALEFILEVLSAGASMEARENAAATLYSLSSLDEYKIVIGSKLIAIPALVELLRDGTFRGKKDAVTALCNLSMYHGNKARVVQAGAVPLLVALLTDESLGITDDALTVLVLVAGLQEGLTAISQTPVVPVLVNLLRSGSAKGKENSITVLLALCRGGSDHMILSELRISAAIPYLYLLLNMGTPRAKRKASALLKILDTSEPGIVMSSLK